MRKVVVENVGGPEELQLVDTRDLRPGPQEVLVAVEAAGVNYVDIYQRTGLYPVSTPYTPGFEGVGHIEAIGEGVRTFAINDRVAWVNVLGSYADYVVVPIAKAISVPDRFSIGESLLFQSLTAQYLITEYRNINPGETVLVHSAAGGVGQLLVQWLKHLNVRVIGTTSTAEKIETVRALGADFVINYASGGFLEELMDITDGRGVDMAFDAVGKNTLRDTVDALAVRGTAVSYGVSSGPPPAIEPLRLIEKSRRLGGGSIFDYIADPTELRKRCAEILNAIQLGWLQPGEGSSYSLDSVVNAHRALESRMTQGKLNLKP